MSDQHPDSVAPHDLDALAAFLAQASATQQPVLPVGGGTRQHIGGVPAANAMPLSTRNLNRVIEYSPADLVITVEAGATLGAVQRELAQHNQWLPWDPPCSDRATIGGLLASGAAGPLRLGYGPPRDWLLGMRVVLGDGRIVKSGAKVVKNVAGYDTHKLHLGALGTLGVIGEVTFKVAPRLAAHRTMIAAFTRAPSVATILQQLQAPPLHPIALVAMNDTAAYTMPIVRAFQQGQPRHILVLARFAGAPAAAARQIREATLRCIDAGARCVELSEHDEDTIWREIADYHKPLHDGSILLRSGARPAGILAQAQALEQIATAQGWESERMIWAGTGVGFGRWRGVSSAEVFGAALAELRTRLASEAGYAVVEECPFALSRTERWGADPDGIGLMRVLRQRWDAAGILNPGRYLV